MTESYSAEKTKGRKREDRKTNRRKKTRSSGHCAETTYEQIMCLAEQTSERNKYGQRIVDRIDIRP